MYHMLDLCPNGEVVRPLDLTDWVSVICRYEVKAVTVLLEAFNCEFTVDLGDHNITAPSVLSLLNNEQITVVDLIINHRIAENANESYCLRAASQILVDADVFRILLNDLWISGRNRDRKIR